MDGVGLLLHRVHTGKSGIEALGLRDMGTEWEGEDEEVTVEEVAGAADRLLPPIGTTLDEATAAGVTRAAELGWESDGDNHLTTRMRYDNPNSTGQSTKGGRCSWRA